MDNLYYNKKKLKQILNKRTGKIRKIWGWILTGLGLLTFTDLFTDPSVTNLVDGLIVLIPGVILLATTYWQVRKWDRYDAIIDNHGNTPIPLIAERMKLPEKTVYSDLQKMVVNDFFIGPNADIGSYVDAERELLVMTYAGQPIKPLPEPAQYYQAQAEPEYDEGQDAAAYSSEPEEDYVDINESEMELTDLDVIRQAIAHTSDDALRGYLYGIEGSFRRIDERVQSEPALKQKTSIRRLYKYYLPQIIELIGKLKEPQTTPEMKKQITATLRDSATAFANIEADIMDKDQMDLEVEMDVLRNMFAQDGLLKEEWQKEKGI